MSSDLGPLGPLWNESEERDCARCERPLTVRDTREHEVLTAFGPRGVVEVTLRCPDHRQTIAPRSPITPPKSPFAFDLVAEAGVLRFLHHRQLLEIREEFHRRGLPRIPLRTVQRLTDRFALYHTAVHLESLPRLREALRRSGGYVLVLDGTGEVGNMTLEFTDDDESGGTGWTLLAAPVVKEDEDLVRPHLERLGNALGPPLAGISDQSDGLREAFRVAFPGVYLLLCHYHVLRGIGESLAGIRYHRFKVELDRSGVKGRLNRFVRRLRKEKGRSREARSSLTWAEEILSSGKAAKGCAYPFFWEGLEFYRRCDAARGRLQEVLSRPGRRGKGAPYRRLEEILGRLSPPPKSRRRLVQDFPVLMARWRWFERTRRVLGYRNGPVPFSPSGTLSEKGLERGRRRLDWLLSRIEEETGRKSRSPLVRELHRQLERVAEKLRLHREELFAPNVVVRVSGRRRVRRLHRSNGAAERQFRRLRRHGRRITANRDVEGIVGREGPGMLLVANLQDSGTSGRCTGPSLTSENGSPGCPRRPWKRRKLSSAVRWFHRQAARLAVNNRVESRGQSQARERVRTSRSVRTRGGRRGRFECAGGFFLVGGAPLEPGLRPAPRRCWFTTRRRGVPSFNPEVPMEPGDGVSSAGLRYRWTAEYWSPRVMPCEETRVRRCSPTRWRNGSPKANRLPPEALEK